MPHTEFAIADYYIIAPAEASSNLARYDGARYGYRGSDSKNLSEMYKQSRSAGFGPEVKRRIMIGTYALSSGYYEAYYGRAMRVRTFIKRDFEKVFAQVDALLTRVTRPRHSRSAKKHKILSKCTFPTSTPSQQILPESRRSLCPVDLPPPACRSGSKSWRIISKKRPCCDSPRPICRLIPSRLPR